MIKLTFMLALVFSRMLGIRLWFGLVLIALLALPLVRADQNPLSIRTLALEKGDMPEWYVAVKDGKFEQLQWSANQASAAIATMAGVELELFTKATNEAGESYFLGVTKIAIPQGAKEVLLLGLPKGDGEQAKVDAISDEYLQAKFDDWIVINKSDQQVTLRYGKDNEPVSVDAGVAQIYKIKAEPDKGGELIIQTMQKDEMKTIYSTFWGATSKQRSLVLIYSEDDRIKVRKVVDYLPVR